MTAYINSLENQYLVHNSLDLYFQDAITPQNIA